MKNINVLLASLMIIGLMTGCGNTGNNTNIATEDPITEDFANGEDATNTDELLDELWTNLNGYWQYVMTDSDSDDMEFIFYYFGYDDNYAPFCNIVWGYEGGEWEYVTNVSKLDQHRYRITFEVPANHEEDGLFEVHDAYTVMRDYDLTDYSNKKITVESSGKLSDWKYIGTEFPENLFE